jgi:Protein of unknown function (DUF2510)
LPDASLEKRGKLLEFLGTLRGHTISIDSQTRLPAGWYTDPGQSGGKRWWDGTQWTSHLKLPDAPATRSTAGHVDPHTIGVVPASDYAPSDETVSTPDHPHRSTDVNSNSAALLSLVFGLFAVGFTLVSYLPGPRMYWVAGSGAIAILLGTIAIGQRVSGRSTNSWAPIIGILIGGAATAVVVMGIAIPGLVDPAASELQPTSSTTATTQIAPRAPSSEPFVFSTNPVLTASGSVAQQVATALNQKYAAGKPTLTTGQSWPATLKLVGSEVIAPDGSVLATIPTGHPLGYALSIDHASYTVTVTGANPTEVASYYSDADQFSFRCASTDSDCVPAD